MTRQRKRISGRPSGKFARKVSIKDFANLRTPPVELFEQTCGAISTFVSESFCQSIQQGRLGGHSPGRLVSLNAQTIFEPKQKIMVREQRLDVGFGDQLSR